MHNFYYHTICKDELDVNKIYTVFENILKDKKLKAKKQKYLEKRTFNGDSFISLCSFVSKDPYKVPFLSKEDFFSSKLSRMYTYDMYLSTLLAPSYKEEEMSKEDFLNSSLVDHFLDYFAYLDSISTLYPIDIGIQYKDYIPKDPILNYLYEKTKEESPYGEVGFFLRNENAYQKYVENHRGITFIISKNIEVVSTILIPNLPRNFFPLELEQEMENCTHRRYSNLTGEVQVRDEIFLDKIEGIILGEDINHDMVKKLLHKYQIDLPVYERREQWNL